MKTFFQNLNVNEVAPLAVFLLILACVWWIFGRFEDKTLYYPDRQLMVTPQQVGLACVNVRIRTSDGEMVSGWFISGSPSQANRKTILLFHGNAGNMSHRLDKAKRLLSVGVNVFLLDYRGYGESTGRPSEKGTYRDAEAAWRYLTQEAKIPPKQIILYGESLGGGVATEMATRVAAGGLILDSAFTSTMEMAKRVFPFLPAKIIVRNRYDNLAKIRRLQLPLLVLHSPQDEIVPFEMGKTLYDLAPEPKRFVPLVGSHNEGYIDSGKIYPQAIQMFLGSLES